MTKIDSTAALSGGQVLTLSAQMRTLVIGEIVKWTGAGQTMPDVEAMRFVDLADVTEQLLSNFAPDLVLSPLVQDGYDAIEVAMQLQDLAYTGLFRAVVQGLPNPRLVAAEVAAIAPEVDFEIIDLGKKAS